MNHLSKNNYYDGKHLSTDCFKTEQEYTAAKLSQMSKLIFGKGIICGFNVTAMKFYPDTIEIGSGAAVDGEGRLITIYDKITLPVMAVDGFKSSEKTHTLRAVYKETQESADIITERCAFTYGDTQGVELAQIIFKHGKIESIRDARTPLDSQFLKGLSEKSISTFENQIDSRITAVFYKYLPSFVKSVNDNLEHRLKEISIKNRKKQEESEKRIYDASIEYTNVIYKSLEKKFETLLDKVKDLDEKLDKIKSSSIPMEKSAAVIVRRSGGFRGRRGRKR